MIFRFDQFRRDAGFRFVKGCRASCEKKLREGFEETERGFVANVSAENIDRLMRDYVAAQTEELFLFIEKPCNLAEEEPDERGVVTQPHVNVYYWDGITKEQANVVLDKYGDWLINDGFVCFGFGVKGCASEIMKDKYIRTSSSQPRRSAPSRITSRLQPAANFLSLNFFLREDTSMSVQDFEGRMRAAAPIRPVSSSAAKRTFSISWTGSTSEQGP